VVCPTEDGAPTANDASEGAKAVVKGEPHAAGEGVDIGTRAGVIAPESVRVWEDDYSRLCISVDGEESVDVRALRAFPVSGKADYVSFLNKDDKEIALVARPGKLDRESRSALHNALDKMYYVPKISQVYKLTEKMGVTNWRVMTDCGFASFEVVDRQHIRKLPNNRLLIKDADGNRFEIEDTLRLDDRSQVLIRSEI